MMNEAIEKTRQQRQILSVSEVTQDIKLLLDNTFTDVWVEGEISNFRPHASGHLYFSLKDQKAVLLAVVFSRAAKDIKFRLEDGLQVVCRGSIEVYPPHGKYQLIVESIEPKGIGSLQLALEQLKERLQKEGLFKEERKRPVPYLPSKIGVVTSSSGAAINDILKVLDRRFSEAHIIFRPAQVQGRDAKDDIARAIKDLNDFNRSLSAQEKIEVIIVGRGGGSVEDLWAFNEEVVARAIYASSIPVISAVGHERDWTVSDLVADVRAATPSQAAELVLPEKKELLGRITENKESLTRAVEEKIYDFKEGLAELGRRSCLGVENILRFYGSEFEAAAKKLKLLNPASRIIDHRQRLDDFVRQIYVRTEHLLALKSSRFSSLAGKLSSLSPLNILGRGYSITFKMPQETVAKDSRLLQEGDLIRTRLHKGELLSRVTEVKVNG